MASHPSEEELEQYAMRACPEQEEVWVEEHLLLCEECRSTVGELDVFLEAFRQTAPESLEPGLFRHKVGDQHIELHVWRSKQAGWTGRIEGADVEAQAIFDTLEETMEYVRRSFEELFPEHRCGPQCGGAS